MPVDPRELAVLSKAAYESTNTERVKQTIESGGFDSSSVVILPSTNNDALVTRLKNGDGKPYTDTIVIAVRGTDISNESSNRGRDMSHWPAIFVGASKNDKRVQEVRELIKSIRASHPLNKIILTGHSLGGWVSATLAKEMNLKAVVFNPGSGIDAPFRDFDKNVLVFKTEGDVVSATSSGNNVIVLPKKDSLGAHDLDNFVDLDYSVYMDDFASFLDSLSSGAQPSIEQEDTASNNGGIGTVVAGALRGAPAGSRTYGISPSSTIPIEVQMRALILDSLYKRDPVLFAKAYKALVQSNPEAESVLTPQMLKRWFSDDDSNTNFNGVFIEEGLEQHMFLHDENVSSRLVIPVKGAITDSDGELNRLVLGGDRLAAEELFRESDQYNYIMAAVEHQFDRAGVGSIELLGHSLGGFKTRVLLADLRSQLNLPEDVIISAHVFNGHVTENMVSGNDVLHENTTLEYHTIAGDVTDFKGFKFRAVETANNANFNYYTVDKSKFLKDFLALKDPEARAQFYKRFHRQMVNEHDVDHFHDVTVRKKGGQWVIEDIPSNGPVDRSVAAFLESNRGRTFLAGAKIAGGAGAGIAGELIAGALDKYLDTGVAGDLEHIAVSAASGTLLYGVASAVGTGVRGVVGGGMGALKGIGGVIGENFISGALEFGPAALVGMAAQYGVSKIVDFALEKSGWDKESASITSGIVGGSAGGSLAGAAGALMFGGPVGWAVASGLMMGFALSSIGAVVEVAMGGNNQNGSARDSQEIQLYKSRHLGVDDSHLLTSMSDDDRSQYQKKVIDLEKVLSKYISKSGPTSPLANDIRTQLLGTDAESLTHVSNFPTSDELETLLSCVEAMTNFDIKKNKRGPEYSDDGKTISPEEYVLQGRTSDYYGFDKLYAAFSSFKEDFKDQQVYDQFVSGHWEDDDFQKFTEHLDNSSKTLGITRNDGEELYDFLARAHGEETKQLENAGSQMGVKRREGETDDSFRSRVRYMYNTQVGNNTTGLNIQSLQRGKRRQYAEKRGLKRQRTESDQEFHERIVRWQKYDATVSEESTASGVYSNTLSSGGTDADAQTAAADAYRASVQSDIQDIYGPSVATS